MTICFVSQYTTLILKFGGDLWYLHWFNQGTNHLGTKLHHFKELEEKIVLSKTPYNFEETHKSGKKLPD